MARPKRIEMAPEDLASELYIGAMQNVCDALEAYFTALDRWPDTPHAARWLAVADAYRVWHERRELNAAAASEKGLDPAARVSDADREGA